MIVGNYVILNLFLAILIQGFADEDEEKRKIEESEAEARKKKLEEARAAAKKKILKPFGAGGLLARAKAQIAAEEAETSEPAAAERDCKGRCLERLSAPFRACQRKFDEYEDRKRRQKIIQGDGRRSKTPVGSGRISAMSVRSRSVSPGLSVDGSEGSYKTRRLSMKQQMESDTWMLPPEYQAKEWNLAKKIVKHNWFESVIIVTIIVSSVFLAIEDPSRDPPMWMRVLDMSFLGIFTLEMGLKHVAYGAIFKKPVHNAEGKLTDEGPSKPSSLLRFLPDLQYLLKPASGVWLLGCGVLTSREA